MALSNGISPTWQAALQSIHSGCILESYLMGSRPLQRRRFALHTNTLHDLLSVFAAKKKQCICDIIGHHIHTTEPYFLKFAVVAFETDFNSHLHTMRPLHEELADELLSFYRLLIHLYIPEHALKVPPAQGWPESTIRAHFKPGEKDEAVIKLLNHIPYLQDLGGEGFQIWENCVCNDFSGRVTGWTEPLEEQKDDCEWPALETERGKHLATLGICHGRDGLWIFCDVRTREMIIIDFQMGWTHKEDRPSDFFNGFKEDFRNFDAFLTRHKEVRFSHKYDEAQFKRVREIFVRHGWPTEDYRKDECLAELAAT
jgi:hypothetical protein